MHSFVAIFGVFICFTTTIAFVENVPQLRSHRIRVGENSYFVYPDVTKNFIDSLDFCKSNNQKLAVINNQNENAELVAQMKILFNEDALLWIAGALIPSTGDWIWLPSRDTITSFDWGTGEPTMKNEFCLSIKPHFFKSGTWNDQDCSTVGYPLCQTVS
ncbi:unnamed protein product [Psylliodes chrysocephalus]|uniref:C-type lectin domain-containing protein n=1 Tax=Psylliodes chrysocephalus TaxID=3402493 RepID=A0A9P0G791_9CUCU|nr:unnamed protein product [Psylliodes chrysocephala]